MPPYTHIIHVADVHIRIGTDDTARAEEYVAVFNNFTNSIAALPSIKANAALIVVCGDVFHHKTRCDTTSLYLWNVFIKALAKLAPVVLICGNHDYRQEESGKRDMLDVLCHKLKLRNPVHYLQTTGHHTIDNVTFSLVSIKDTLKSYNTRGVVDELPPFPQPVDGQTNVALFHGTISQTALPNGQLLPAGHGYPLDWFGSHNLILLGDNHKQQINYDENRTWAYPGSLIQQDIGEPVFGHGYILWDLAKCAGTPYHVYNPYGRFRTTLRNDECFIKLSNDQMYKPIRDTAFLVDFPKTPCVIFEGNADAEGAVVAALAAAGIEPSSLHTTLVVRNDAKSIETDDEQIQSVLQHLADINHSSKWLEFLHTVSPSFAEKVERLGWIADPQKILFDAVVNTALPTQFLEKIAERRTKIQDLFAKLEEKTQVFQQRSSVVLKHMRWSWPFCYGENNYFDFESINGNIVLLNGANAHGKSAFIDTLLIGLFGEANHSRAATTKKMSIEYINKNKPPKSSPLYVAVLFEVNDKLYEICRSFVENKAFDDSIQVRECGIYTVQPKGYGRTILVQGTKSVDEWIAKHVGTIDDIVRTSVVSQIDTRNFFTLKPADQKTIIDNALNLDGLKAFGEILSQTVIACKYLDDSAEGILTGMGAAANDDSADGDVDDLEAKYTNMVQRIETVTNEKDDLSRQLGRFANCRPPGDIDLWQTKLGNAAATETYDASSNKQRRVVLLHELGDVDAETCAAAEAIQDARSSLSKYRKKLDQWLVKEPAAVAQPSQDEQEEIEAWFEAHPALKDIDDSNDDWMLMKPPNPPEGTLYPDVHPDAQWRDVIASYHAAAEQLRATDDAHTRMAAITAQPTLTKEAYRTWVHKEYGPYHENVEECEENEYPSYGECQDNIKKTQKCIDYLERTQKTVEDLTADHARIAKRVATLEAYAVKHKYDACMSRVPEGATLKDAVAKVAAYDAMVKHKEAMRVARKAIDAMATDAFHNDWQQWEARLREVEENGWTDVAAIQSKLETDDADLAQHRELTAAIANTQANVASLADYRFNPSCEACRCNPFQKQKKDAARRLDDATRRLACLRPIAEIQTSKKMWKHALAIVTEVERERPYIERRRREFDERLAVEEQRYAEEKRQWSKAKKALGADASCTLSALSALVDDLRYIDAHRDLVAENDAALAEASAQLEKTVRDLAKARASVEKAGDADTLASTLEYWTRAAEVTYDIEKNAQRIERETAAWEEAKAKWKDVERLDNHAKVLEAAKGQCQEALAIAFATWKVVGEAIVKCARLAAIEADVAAYAAYEAWVEERDALQARVNACEVAIKKKELASIEAALRHHETKEEALAAVAWFKYQATVNELTTLAKQRDDLVSRLEAARRNAEKRANAGRVTQMYAALRKSWMERSETAAQLLSLLIGDKTTDNGAFKEWVYKEHIIPVIESQMNTFLEPLDNIRIRISHNSKSFMFMVRDRNHEATYQSSSGYQQFLVNLAIRQALANINSKGNNLKHMIIDEGFGACDASNIMKARDMLNRLVLCGGFRSIILVSHLEALRDAIEIKIPVERVGIFASLKYGTPYPQPRMVTAEGEALPSKPTRGRARKNAV